MYNYRSRFIHGEIPFPNYFSEADATPEYEKFFEKTEECVDIATSILLASLQELIRRKWYSLDFKYSLNQPKIQ